MCVDNQLGSVIREDADITPITPHSVNHGGVTGSPTPIGAAEGPRARVKARMRVGERSC